MDQINVLKKLFKLKFLLLFFIILTIIQDFDTELYNSETVLLTVESIKLDDENNQLENIKFLKGFSYLFYQQLFDSGLF